MGVIDVHAHFYPKAYMTLLRNAVAREDSEWSRAVQRFLNGRDLDALGDVEGRLRDMDAAGIETQVLSLSHPLTYLPNEKDSVEAARIVNDTQAEICARYPGRFKGFIALPLPYIDASLAELDRALNTLSLHGVFLGSHIHGVPVDDEQFLPLYEAINREKVAVLLHSQWPPGIEEAYKAGAPALAGFYGLALVLVGLARRGVFEDNPDIKVIVPELGTVLLSSWSRLTSEFAPGTTPQKSITDHVGNLYFDSICTHLPFWQCAIDTVGIDHIVFGSDYPIVPVGGPPPISRIKTSLQTIESLGLSAADKERILSGNAAAILR